MSEDNKKNENEQDEALAKARELTEEGLKGLNGELEIEWGTGVWCLKEAIKICDYAEAYTLLGAAYYYGQGAEQSYEIAAKLFRHAADLEDPEAMYRLAGCYKEGLGVEQSREKYLKWLTESAALGFTKAESACGEIEIFCGEDEIVERGITLLCDAASKGDERAEELVVRLDDDKAVTKASEDGEIASRRPLTDRQRELLADGIYKIAYSSMTGPQFEYTYKVTAFWLSRAAADGNTDAMYECASMMLEGDGVMGSPASGWELMLEAAEKGNPDAEFAAGRLYFEGRIVERDDEKAFEWLMKAATDGSEDAKEYLLWHFE